MSLKTCLEDQNLFRPSLSMVQRATESKEIWYWGTNWAALCIFFFLVFWLTQPHNQDLKLRMEFPMCVHIIYPRSSDFYGHIYHSGKEPRKGEDSDCVNLGWVLRMWPSEKLLKDACLRMRLLKETSCLTVLIWMLTYNKRRRHFTDFKNYTDNEILVAFLTISHNFYTQWLNITNLSLVKQNIIIIK